MSAVINSTLLSVATARSSVEPPHEKFSKLFAQSVYRETLSRREEELNDRLCGDLPHPFRHWSNLAYGKEEELRIQDDQVCLNSAPVEEP